MTHSCSRLHVGRVHRDAYRVLAVPTQSPSHEEIARLAYAYWEARGHPQGTSQEDWYRAERELRRPRV
jgi:hypothetical protein